MIKDDKDEENVYICIKRGTIFNIRVIIGRGTAEIVEVCQYRVSGMYRCKNIYKKWSMNSEKTLSR